MTGFGIILILSLLLIHPGFSLDEFYDEEFQSSDAAVRKFWGVQDVTVSVGKLLHCKIPSDAFKGQIVSYDVKGDDEKPLPPWLIFNKETNVLEGIPSENDIGDVRVNVKAFDSRGHFVRDMFVVEVYPLLEKNTNNKRKCKKGEEVNMVAIIVDKSIDDFTPAQKIKALRTVSAYFDIHIDTLLVLSAKFIEDVDTSSMFGTGQNMGHSYSNRSVMTWQVGCNEKIWAEKLKDVKLVKKYVKDGTLSALLKLPLLDSRLVSSPNPFRLRRQVSTQTNDTEKPISIDNEDDSEGDEPDDPNDGEDDEDADAEFDKNPPVPPEIESSAVSDTYGPTSVFDKSVVSGTDGVDLSLLNKMSHSPKNIPPPLSDDDSNKDEEDSTESAFDDGENLLPNNGSDSFVLRTPDLPSNGTLLNTSTISVAPLPAQNSDNVTISPSQAKRYPPEVMHNLENFVAIAGKNYTFRIPENIFHDVEDGNTSNLTLKLLYPQLEDLFCPPWFEFDAKKKEILMLPRIDSISEHTFVIEAVDSDGKSANNSLTVAVQYPQNTQRVNFEISLHMKPVKNRNLNVTFQLELLQRLAKLYGDETASYISVRNISCNPFVLTWTNNSLSFDSCDNVTILNLLNVLTNSELSSTVNEKVRLEMSSLVDVEKVSWKGIGLCENAILPRFEVPPKQNFKPVVGVDRIDNITARVGELFVFKIPERAFYDRDVPGKDLKINVLTIDHAPIPIDNWLHYDATNRELFGLPLNPDVGSTKYQVECSDDVNTGEEWKARQVVDVVVEPSPKIQYSIEFNLVLKMSYEDFSKSPSVRRSFIEKLAFLFGDTNTSSIVISTFTPGSVIVTWHNKSLPVDQCPETDIQSLRKVLLDDEGKLNERVNVILGPTFVVKSAQVTPVGICEGGLTEFHATEMNAPSQEIHAILTAKIPSFIREYFFEYVLPIMIVLLMLLLAAIVACILYRRQRRAKWTLGDEDDRRRYRNKGIPVIFQDELEERLEPTNKSPIIMKEEKPPLPPPEYQKTLPMATTALLSDFDDPSYQQGTITFTTQADRNGRSKATPIYRKPPPYIPP